MLILKQLKIVLVTLGLIAAYGLLAACGSTTATAPDGSKVKVDGGGDKVSVESEDGKVSVDLQGAKLPEGFPKQDVPLVEGKIIQAITESTSGSFHVTLTTSASDPKAALDQAVSKLKDVGFKSDSSVNIGITATETMKSDKWDVIIVATEGPDAKSSALAYQVMPHQG